MMLSYSYFFTVCYVNTSKTWIWPIQYYLDKASKSIQTTTCTVYFQPIWELQCIKDVEPCEMYKKMKPVQFCSGFIFCTFPRAQWLNGRVNYLRSRGRWFETYWRPSIFEGETPYPLLQGNVPKWLKNVDLGIMCGQKLTFRASETAKYDNDKHFKKQLCLNMLPAHFWK